jgi:hypothetical protein
VIYFFDGASSLGEAELDGGTSFTFHTILGSLVFVGVAGG